VHNIFKSIAELIHPQGLPVDKQPSRLDRLYDISERSDGLNRDLDDVAGL
jgi:hypothetical protein